MPQGLLPILPHVPAFMLVLFRITGIFIFAPMFGSNVIPARIKVMLALTLAFCVYPLIPPQLPLPLSMGTLAVAVGSELLIGLIIGYGASLPLVAMQMGGLLMGQQLGLGLAQVFNPDFQQETDVMSQFLSIMALTIFILLDGHHAMLAALVHSFDSVPLGGYRPDGQLVQLAVGLLGASFELAIRVAAPLLCLIFLETVAMGFVARTVPHLNILSLGFPMRIMFGLALMAAMATSMSDSLGVLIRQSIRVVTHYFVPS